MKSMRIFGAATLLLAALPATAALSPGHAEWGAGPASVLFSPAERQSWLALATDAEAEAFVRLFWARRDPDPATPVNELRAEIERRVVFADRRFAAGARRGALTDRGRVYVLLGAPSDVVRLNPSGPGDPEVPYADEEFGTLERQAVPTRETWYYSKEKKPSFVAKKRLEVRFRPDQEGGVEFADAQDAAELLAAAAEATVRRPDLTLGDLAGAAEAGVAAPGAGGAAALAPLASWHAAPADPAAVAALRARLASPAAAAEAGPSLDAGVFQAYDGSWIVPFQVSMPAAAAAAQRAVVEISRSDGGALSSFLLADPWKQADGRAYLQGNTVLPPGEYRLAVGLLDVRGEASWAAERPVVVPGGAPAFWLSELILGARLSPLGRPQDLLEPYTWMSVAVPPRGGGAFAQGETLWFYAHACNVGLDAAGRPALDTVLELSGKLKFHGPVEMTPARVNSGCWALAQSLDLPAATFAPGTYRLAIEVTDRTTGQRLSSARAFEIREP